MCRVPALALHRPRKRPLSKAGSVVFQRDTDRLHLILIVALQSSIRSAALCCGESIEIQPDRQPIHPSRRQLRVQVV